MEFKGTKGKWTVEEKEDAVYDQVVFAISTNHNEEFITIWNGVENLNEEQRANALLISKAPEMLELIKSFCNANPNDGTWNYQSCMEKAHQLIKEATEL